MANKFLTLSGLKAAVAKTDSADVADGPLGKALKLYEFFGEDRMNERRDALDDVIEAVPAAKKKAASYDRVVLKYLDDVLKTATGERKKIESDLVKYGMKKVKVQVLMTDWRGQPMRGRQVFLMFKCPDKPQIILKKEVKDGIMEFNDVELAPSGSFIVNAFPSRGASDQAKGLDTYDLPKTSLVRIKAKQKNREIKKKAKSALEASRKAGLKGTAGIDWIVKVGGEVTSEKELKTSYEEEIEFTITAPDDSLNVEMTK